MKRITMPALALFLLGAVAATAQDQAADRAAILAVIDQAFAAVASGDPEDWRAIQIAEGTTLSFRPDGKGGQAATHSFRFEDGDLVLDFKTPDGWRFYRRLQRVESFQSDD